MPYDLSRLLVVAVTSRALFDLEWEARMYDRLGVGAFKQHQLDSEDDKLEPGTAFSFVSGLLKLNEPGQERAVEVIVVSRNQPDVGIRVTKSIQAHGLDISRIAYIGGEPIVPYLTAYKSRGSLSSAESTAR
jgi:5'-nucleotidase